MKKLQNNKLSMNYSVQKVCKENQSIWTGFVAFENAFSDFDATVIATGKSLEKQGVNIKGVSMDKAAVKQNMVDKALEVGGAVFAFATDSGNLTLKEKLNYSRTALEHARNAVSEQSCRSICNEAIGVQESLATYGVSAADLADLDSKINAFASMIAAPRVAVTNRMGATSDLAKLLAKTDSILQNKLDKLVEKFRKSQPEFYKQYFDARIIIDTGSRHKIPDDTGSISPVS